jgi:hypothetical protein
VPGKDHLWWFGDQDAVVDEFEDRGSHALKGVPGDWRLFAVRG